MKRKLLAILMILTLLFGLVSCAAETKATVEEPQQKTEVQETGTAPAAGSSIPAEGLWKEATNRENKTFGTGSKTIKVQVKADGKSVEFTVKTDKDNLADALLEHGLVEGENSSYGLYVKKVNGILADYDIDQSYWSFEVDGVAQMVGISGAEIKGGEHYELVYTK